MTTAAERIPFAVEISRMIELLAAQIYPSPFALLRENVQNSFDAILLRKQSGRWTPEPRIDVSIEPTRVRVVDNGIRNVAREGSDHARCARHRLYFCAYNEPAFQKWVRSFFARHSDCHCRRP